MKRFFANLVISAAGRILFPLISALISAGVAWLATKLPWAKPLLELVSPGELAVIVMSVLMTGLLAKAHKVLGENVAPVQRWLRGQGYDLSDDGWFGEKTATALHKETGLPVRQAVPIIKGNPAKNR